MNILLGDKKKLALECIESCDEQSLGRLFLYVNGVRLGEDTFDFEVDAMIDNTLSHFKVYGTNLKGLADCPADELFESYARVSSFDEEEDDIKELGDIPAVKYMPDFIAKFVDVDNCVFRYVDYAFDRCFIILIPVGEKLKLYVRDDHSGFCTETITTPDDFLGLWKEMAIKRKDDNKTSPIKRG